MSLIKKTLRAVGVMAVWRALRYRWTKYQREKTGFRINKKIEWLGGRWSGFFVDTSQINHSSVILSFGVGNDISFDLSLHKKGAEQIYLFDPTPISNEFIQNLKTPKTFSFFPVGLSDNDSMQTFYLPKDLSRVSGSNFLLSHLESNRKVHVQMKKLSTIMRELNIHTIDLLKIDIEGSEFDVIKNIMDEQIRPRQICVEFHARYFDDGNKRMDDSINLLKKNNYTVGAYTDGEEYLFLYQ